MTIEEAVLQHYADAFASRNERGSGGWLAGMRRDAGARFLDLGFPTTRMEEWRYTNVASVARTSYAMPVPSADGGASSPATLDARLTDLGGDRLVFVDGSYDEALSRRRSSARELTFERLASAENAAQPSDAAAGFGQLADAKDDAFTSLNTALATDGALLRVGDGCGIEHPIHVVFAGRASPASADASHPRLLVRAGAGSAARIVVDHLSLDEGDALTNAVTEIFVERDAFLEILLVQREGAGTHHIASQTAQLGRGGRLTHHTLDLGGALVRNDLTVRLVEESAECELRGLYLAGGEQVVDNHTLVDHAVPRCRSTELYKGIVGGRGRGVFRGRVLVRPDAQQTDAEQQNRSLLLSRKAEVDAKPQLEIYADDVKCSHGSSIGQLDAEALFFLRARGLSEPAARALLAEGFAREITEGPHHAPLREFCFHLVKERLAALLDAGGPR